METFIGGVAVVAISGLAWVAYTHPQGYNRIYIAISLVAFLIGLAGTGYYIGHQAGWHGAVVATDQVLADTSVWQEPFNYWLVNGLWFAFAIYATFLSYLPQILGTTGKKDAPTE